MGAALSKLLSTLLGALTAVLGAALDALAAALGNWLRGLAGLWGLGRLAWRERKGDGSLAGRVLPHLARPAGQRDLFAALRAFWPTLKLSAALVKAYPNEGTVIVTRRADVLEVLRRDADFAVVYEPRMREITAGPNFFLGMQPGPDYERDATAMRLAVRHADVPAFVAPRAAALAREIVAGAGGALDVPAQLGGPVAADVIQTYFGLGPALGAPDRATMIAEATAMFWFLFNDLGADPEVGAKGRAAAASARKWLDAAIAARKASPGEGDSVLARLAALQKAGAPGLDDLGVRNNLIGLYIGAIPTLSKAATLALDELLDRPAELRAACNAAKAGDAETVAGHVWEALRFNPHNPVVYRRALTETRIARGTLRSRRIPEGAMVFAATHSAMFDSLDVPDAGQFRIDRPWETYIHWGEGLHRCFGAEINRAVIPAMLTPLLAQPNLRRTGPRVDGGTPFPQSLPVAFG